VAIARADHRDQDSDQDHGTWSGLASHYSRHPALRTTQQGDIDAVLATPQCPRCLPGSGSGGLWLGRVSLDGANESDTALFRSNAHGLSFCLVVRLRTGPRQARGRQMRVTITGLLVAAVGACRLSGSGLATALADEVGPTAIGALHAFVIAPTHPG
jgi:hypothetical protein